MSSCVNRKEMFLRYATALITSLVVTLDNKAFALAFENTTQIVTTSLTVTERSANPFSAQLSGTEAPEGNVEKLCSATLCSTLCPDSFFKCDATETTCVCANSKKASTPNKSCELILSPELANLPKFADADDVIACKSTCRRVAQQVAFYGYRIQLHICDLANITVPITDKSSFCVCYFLNSNAYY